jgi:hypothetical protein
MLVTLCEPMTGLIQQCGGTKTDVAIASKTGGIVARAIGGTGNMAEVGGYY